MVDYVANLFVVVVDFLGVVFIDLEDQTKSLVDNSMVENHSYQDLVDIAVAPDYWVYNSMEH